MSEKHKKHWIVFVCLSYLGFNYLPGFGWWISMAGTGLILTFGYLAWSKDFKHRLGIPTKVIQYVSSFILTIILIFFSYFLLLYIGFQNNLAFAIGNFYGLIHVFFYTLNEEIILGGLLILYLEDKYHKTNPTFISGFMALIFSIMHYVFYRWIFQGNVQGLLTFSTLFSLFLIGMVRNNLIIKTGHIGYPWALHFSWMYLMIGCAFSHPTSMESIPQAQRFNIFIGDEITILIVFTLAVLTSFWILIGGVRLKK